jgi:tetratricopeptide (TPR) repeat protein
MELRFVKAVCGIVVLAAVGFFTLFPQLDWLDLGLADDLEVAAAFDRIQTAIETENWQQAVVDLDRILEIDPNDADSHYLRGIALYGAGQPAKAIPDFDFAISANPDDAEAHLCRAAAYDEVGKPAQALADLNAAIRLAPDSAEAFGIRGKFHEDHGNYQAALGDFEQEAKLAPEDPVALNDLAWILSTAPEKEARDPARALKLAQRAGELDGGQDWESLDTLAAAYAANGKFKSAVRYQSSALAIVSEEDRTVVQERLELYQAKKPYRLGSEPIVASAVVE